MRLQHCIHPNQIYALISVVLEQIGIHYDDLFSFALCLCTTMDWRDSHAAMIIYLLCDCLGLEGDPLCDESLFDLKNVS